MDERIKRARATVAAGDRGERADAGVVEGAAAVGGLVFERGGDLAPSGWRDARAGSRRVHVLAAEYRLDGGVEVGLGDRPAALRGWWRRVGEVVLRVDHGGVDGG